MSKINTGLPDTVLAALAAACGFQIASNRTAGIDEWVLTAGHGATHHQHTGTRQEVCAFLMGYGAMQLQTTQILNELNSAHQKLILDMQARFSPREPYE